MAICDKGKEERCICRDCSNANCERYNCQSCAKKQKQEDISVWLLCGRFKEIDCSK